MSFLRKIWSRKKEFIEAIFNGTKKDPSYYVINPRGKKKI